MRTESLHSPPSSSRMVTEVWTPSICPTKAAMSSASRSVAASRAMSAREMAAMAMAPPSWRSMVSTMRDSSFSRFRLLVRKWRLLAVWKSMPVSIRWAATRWVSGVVLLYMKQPVSVDTAT